MSRISDLAGVLKGARKVAQAVSAQRERSAGDAWLQSSIREGVERALNSRPSPEELGENLYLIWSLSMSNASQWSTLF